MNVQARHIGTIVAAAALALVPVAQAQSPDDRDGLRGPGGIAQLQSGAATHPDNRAVHGAGARQSGGLGTAVRPDDQAGMRGPGAFDGSASGSSSAAHPDNRGEARGPGAFTGAVVESPSSGFDWGDALIGGIGGVGTALLLTGCLFLFLGQRGRTRTA